MNPVNFDLLMAAFALLNVVMLLAALKLGKGEQKLFLDEMAAPSKDTSASVKSDG